MTYPPGKTSLLKPSVIQRLSYKLDYTSVLVLNDFVLRTLSGTHVVMSFYMPPDGPNSSHKSLQQINAAKSTNA